MEAVRPRRVGIFGNVEGGVPIDGGVGARDVKGAPPGVRLLERRGEQR